VSRRRLWLLLAAALCVVGGIAADRLLVASSWGRGQADPTAYASWRHRVQHFETLPDTPSVAMLGDSLTELAEWHELIGPQVGNRGISGDTTGGLRARLAASTPASARTVVIMIGTNDVRHSAWRLEDSVANVSAILDGLKGRRVILQSVLYTGDAKQNARIDRLNRAYAGLCRTGRCEWLDLNPVVAPKGRLTPAESLDGRHLTAQSYGRWAAVLRARLTPG
jgi:lysophospholipase L1-like esterase